MTRFEWQRRHLLITIVAVILILVSISGVAYAKYVKTDRFGGKVNISADIGTIVLQERKAVRQENGEYKLTEEVVSGNSYSLIPGMDIPKDPHVVITKPNDMPVYVFVEVVDKLGTNSGVSYSLTADWTKLDGVTGPNNGAVYYYNQEIASTDTLYILKDNRVYVSQNLNKNATSLGLTFYASMKQAVGGQTPEQIYKDTNY